MYLQQRMSSTLPKDGKPLTDQQKQQKFMDYVAYHGTFDDIPVDRIVAAWKKEFGEDRVAAWIKAFEQSDGKLKRNFYQEDVIDA